MGFEVIEVPDLPVPGQFSHVVKKGNMVFISGQTAVPEADRGNLDPMAHAERVFGYIKSAVEAAGGDCVLLDVAGHHHYSILDAMANPRHPFGKMVLEQIGVA